MEKHAQLRMVFFLAGGFFCIMGGLGFGYGQIRLETTFVLRRLLKQMVDEKYIRER